MNVAETKQILKMMDGIYPAFMKERNAEITLNLWQKIFEDDTYELVSKALMAFIATDTKGFAPAPGAIKEKIRQATETPESRMTEVEAWLIVLRAINGANWHAEENFAKLPPDIQRIVGNPQTLRDWAMMPEDDVHSVVSSNFQRSYRARMAAKRDFDAIPAGFRIAAPEPEYTPYKLVEKNEPDEVFNSVEMPQNVREILNKLGLTEEAS